MSQLFRLVRVGDAHSVTPSSGADLGTALAECATAKAAAHRANTAPIMHWGSTVAQIYFLAAEAFEQGAAVTMGHNRSDRYEARARELREAATSLLAEAREQREESEAARMKAAFRAGYEGRAGARFSFDCRDAFLVGRHFAAQPLPMPARVSIARGKAGTSWVEVDGQRYAVSYPGGKIDLATVALAA